jgi:hypothetical protein
MSDDNRTRLWAHTGPRPTEITQRDAEKGLDIIAAALEAEAPWKTLTPRELFLVHRTDDNANLGDDLKALHISSPELQLREKLDAGLQLAGVVNRRQAKIDGLVLSNHTVIANETGRDQLEAYIKERKAVNPPARG